MQTVEIPADRRITLEVPREVPSGATARFEIRWFPQEKEVSSLDAALEKIWTLCKDSSITVDSFLEMRRQDKELEENQYRQFFSNSGEDN
jgi:hypothetical protein